MSKSLQCNLRLNEGAKALIEAAAQARNRTPFEEFKNAVADGIRWRLAFHPTRPLSLRYLRRQPAEGMWRVWGIHTVAMEAEALGKAPLFDDIASEDYRLVKDPHDPNGAYWLLGRGEFFDHEGEVLVDRKALYDGTPLLTGLKPSGTGALYMQDPEEDKP